MSVAATLQTTKNPKIGLLLFIVILISKPQLRCEKIEEDQRSQARRLGLLWSHSQNYEPVRQRFLNFNKLLETLYISKLRPNLQVA